MDKLSKNRFLAAMGVLGVVAAGAFGVLVVPAWGDAGKKNTSIRTQTTKILTALKDLPGDRNVEDWASHQETLKTRYKDSLQKRIDPDSKLGQWFPGIDENSTFAAFMTPYDDLRVKLEDELIEKGVMLGSPQDDKDGKTVLEKRQPGFNWIQRADIVRADTHEKEMQAKEILQKRFNVCRAIVNAVTANVDKSRRARRLLDVTFLEKFPFLATSTGVSGDSRTYLIPIDGTRYVGFTKIGTGSFSEFALPLNGDKPLPVPEPEGTGGKDKEAPAPPPAKPELHLGRTLTFGFAIVMEYHHVPELIRNLVKPSVEPELDLTIIGLYIFVPEPNPPEKRETRVVSEKQSAEDMQREAAEKTAACPPPLVHVYVTCQVFDLDPAAVPAFLRP